ncbi:MAG: NAD(P)H-binding protein [Acidimicrobiales bacterium]
MTSTDTRSRAAATEADDPAGTRTCVSDTGLDVVTGAFSYSGGAIARELAERGRRIRTLTGHPERASSTSNTSEGPGHVEVAPLDFQDPVRLAASLEGATTLYNTYWVRFPHGDVTHETAVANSRALFHAAQRAGVSRVVHVSITHPSSESQDSYFCGKAAVEQSLAETEMSYAIFRPAILFGGDGVLINNIAWLLRHLPVFAIAGDGQYRVRPIHIDDLARLCADAGTPAADGSRRPDLLEDAVGVERPTFNELVGWVAEATKSRARIVHVPAAIVPPVSAVLGKVLHDVLLTRDELHSMMQGRADTDGEATGRVLVSKWVAEHGHELGLRYANEIDRHFRRPERPR